MLRDLGSDAVIQSPHTVPLSAPFTAFLSVTPPSCSAQLLLLAWSRPDPSCLPPLVQMAVEHECGQLKEWERESGAAAEWWQCVALAAGMDGQPEGALLSCNAYITPVRCSSPTDVASLSPHY